MVDYDLLRDISIKDWSDETKDYVKVFNFDQLLSTPEHCFLFQAYVFDICEGEETRLMSVGVRIISLLNLTK